MFVFTFCLAAAFVVELEVVGRTVVGLLVVEGVTVRLEDDVVAGLVVALLVVGRVVVGRVVEEETPTLLAGLVVEGLVAGRP